MARKGTNIYKRKDGRWEARYVKEVNPDGTKKYASVYGHSYREAKEKQLLCIKGNAPVSRSDSNMLLEELMWKWLGSIANSIKMTTYNKYSSMIRTHLTSGVGKIPIKNLNNQILSAFISEKLGGEHGLSPKTVNDLLVILGQAFNYAEQEFGFRKPSFRRVKEERKEMRVLSVEEQQVLERYLLKNTDSYKIGILLALYSGLRVGELCALQWEDISNGTITVNKTLHRIKSGDRTVVAFSTPKTPSSNRMVPLPTFIAGMIEPYRSAGPVLTTERGKIVEPRLLQMKFQKYIAECGLDHANFHALRHPYVKHTTKKYFLQKQKSQTIKHTAMVWDSGFFNHLKEQILNRTGLGLCT